MVTVGVAEYLPERLHLAFESASRHDGISSRHLSLAGRPVELRFAGHILHENLMPSFHGIAMSSGTVPHTPPEMKVYAWGGTSETGFPCPELLAEFSRYPDKISAVNSDRIHLQYNPEGGILSLVDMENATAYYYVAEPERLPDYELCTPMRMIMNWYCRMNGLLFIHSAAVGHNHSGALIVGRSGAGKSTTGLRCMLKGMEYLGDDYLALSRSTPAIAYAVYRGCKVMDDALRLMPELRPHVMMRNPEHNKSVVMLPDGIGKLVASFAIGSIVRPSICNADRTTFTPIGTLQCVRELAGSTILQMPGTGPYMLRDLTELCRSIPCFEMKLGTDAGEIAESLRAFLAERVCA